MLIGVLAVVVGFVAGAIPFSQIFAVRLRGTDLRTVESGTVSGTSLYRVAGFPVLAVAGVLEVAKGAVGPLVAGDHHYAAALAAGAAVAGHNWSPFLRGAGGRGISPAIGAFLVVAWPGAVLLLLGMIIGKLVHRTGLGSFVADMLLVPVLAVTHGGPGAVAGAAVLVPMVAKRIAGNGPPPASLPRKRVYASRLLYDNDTFARS
jgi:glycerol-3-phosphate acyltransferase PlsY